MLSNGLRRDIHKGDEVYWNDPDDGICSRSIKIVSIDYLPEGVVRITDENGSLVECYLSELS